MTALFHAVHAACERQWAHCDLQRRTGVYAPSGARGEETTWRDFCGATDRALMEAAIAAGVWAEPPHSPVLAHLLSLPAKEWQRVRLAGEIGG